MGMDATELQALTKIEGRLARLEALQETSIRTTSELTANVNRLVEKLDKSDDMAREAFEKAKSAHKRLDKIDKIIFWAATTIIGTVILGVIAMYARGGSA